MPSEPAKTSYAFGGWYTGLNGGGDEFTAATVVSADITVYVKWISLDSKHTVTFDADGGDRDCRLL
jgi:uncharacterized repeat protein (TIGR02543 family)